jgi:ABC-type bacteriocin/lantibiotic exporter with double-glycine peptidase domain
MLRGDNMNPIGTIIRQKTDHWCGPASMEQALKKQGVKVKQEEIAKKTGTTKDGVDPEPLSEMAKRMGVGSKVVSGNKPKELLNNLNNEIKKGKSVILDYLDGNKKTDGHYVTMVKKNKSMLEIIDPYMKKRKLMDIHDFIKHWKDTKISNGKDFKNTAIVIGK